MEKKLTNNKAKAAWDAGPVVVLQVSARLPMSSVANCNIAGASDGSNLPLEPQNAPSGASRARGGRIQQTQGPDGQLSGPP